MGILARSQVFPNPHTVEQRLPSVVSDPEGPLITVPYTALDIQGNFFSLTYMPLLLAVKTYDQSGIYLPSLKYLFQPISCKSLN